MRFPGKSAPAATASAGSSTHENGSPFSVGVLAAMLVCAAAFLGIGAPAASAAPEAQPGWSLLGTFGEAQGSAFEGSQSPLAVDGDGNVFATFQSAGNVNGYAPDGSSLGSYGFTGEVQNLATDFSEDVLYVDNLFGGPITRWVSDGAPTPTYSADPGFTAVPGGAGIAVDPSTNDLLVADPGAEAVRRYDTAGTLLDTIATASIAPTWIAAATDGSFYVAPEGGSDITHVSGTGTVLGTIASVGALEGLAFDPAHELLVASVGGMLKNYDPAGQLESELDGAGATSIAAGENGLLYGLANDAINKYVLATVPGVEAPLVTNIQSTSVHVSAEVDPGAGPPEGSRAHFEYSADGGDSWKETPDEAVERTGTDEPDTIEANLTGLALNTDYLVRVKALNFFNSSTSPATSFSTPEIAPLVETGVASDLSVTSAMLHGTVNPAGLQTGYYFEYGVSMAYGSRVPSTTDAPAGNRRVSRDVSKLVSGLAPGTTYHYRLVAVNAIGETVGADRTFTTLVSSEVFPQRAYEQVTPVDKGGAEVASAGGLHVQTAADGSAIAVNTSAASKGSQSALIYQSYLSRRGSSDWLNWEQVDPPQDGMPGLNESATLAFSEDFEHALVVSNRALAPGGIAGSGNLYVKDLVTGEYAFVASAPGNDGWASLVALQANERIFLGGAPDFRWVVLYSAAPLLPSVTEPAIYRWTRSTGELSVESRLPDNTVPPFFAAQQMTSDQLVYQAVSSNGRVVGFGLAAAGGVIPVGVYRRENGQTTPVSASKIIGDPTEAQPAFFDGMTADGRYMFFHGLVRLTEDAPVPNISSDASLYRYDAATDTLTYLGPTVGGVNARAVFGFSADGQTVYARGTTGGNVWRNGQFQPLTSEPILEGTVSANGRYFSWNDGGGVHLYDAVNDETVCVSCSADGGSGSGATIKEDTRSIGNQTSRSVLDDGTAFFYTPTRLLAADHNGTEDVYAYRDGRLALISPGNDDFNAAFVDASADGSSVFFQTNQGLVKQDVDGNADIYVARVGGGFASQNPAPPPGSCKGAECGEAGAQPVGSPPVATAGTANSQTPRKKHKVHKKHKAHKRHKGKKHKGKRQGARSAAATPSKTHGK